MEKKFVTADDPFNVIQEYFSHDRFATDNGCSIVEARPDYAVCEMEVSEHHLNANKVVMGGAIFTLADFALAIASNLDANPSVSIDCSIRFLSAARGDKLRATCTADKAGRSVGFYTSTVEDADGRVVAIMSATAHRSGKQA